MNSSPKRPYRLLALIAVFVAIGITIPQLSRMSEMKRAKSVSAKTRQDLQLVKSEKGNPPQGKEDQGEEANPDLSVITIPDSHRPKGKVNAPQAVAAATNQV